PIFLTIGDRYESRVSTITHRSPITDHLLLVATIASVPSHCIQYPSKDMLTELGFSIGFIRVSSAGIEHASTVKLAVPGDGMAGAVLSAFVGGFVQFT